MGFEDDQAQAGPRLVSRYDREGSLCLNNFQTGEVIQIRWKTPTFKGRCVRKSDSTSEIVGNCKVKLQRSAGRAQQQTISAAVRSIAVDKVKCTTFFLSSPIVGNLSELKPRTSAFNAGNWDVKKPDIFKAEGFQTTRE